MLHSQYLVFMCTMHIKKTVKTFNHGGESNPQPPPIQNLQPLLVLHTVTGKTDSGKSTPFPNHSKNQIYHNTERNCQIVLFKIYHIKLLP